MIPAIIYVFKTILILVIASYSSLIHINWVYVRYTHKQLIKKLQFFVDEIIYQLFKSMFEVMRKKGLCYLRFTLLLRIVTDKKRERVVI